MSPEIQGNFVSEKISKIRWLPEEYVETQNFITGSWDNVSNSVKIWTFERASEEESIYPKVINEYTIDGDITQIELLDLSTVVVSDSKGCINLLYVSIYEKSTPMRVIFSWKNLHGFSSANKSYPCTSIATLDGEIVSVGEDGSINVLNSRLQNIARSITHADSCSLRCVSYVKHNEIVTGNLRGQMKLWDLRSTSNKPVASFLLSGDQYAATCVTHHPTQYHMVIAGSESGSLAVWDLRQKYFPASLLNAHTEAVNEVKFHPENPRKLLTCSMNGDIWDWNMESITKQTETNVPISSWLSMDDEKTKLMATPLMHYLPHSINSLDCSRNRVLCGADNEAIYLITKII